jgi:alpha-L-rhamnosidase
LDPESPGYQKFLIKPAILDSLQWAEGYHVSPYGKITVSWAKTGESFKLEADIPENTSASVFIQAKSVNDITENGVNITENKDIRLVRFENNYAVLEIASGFYTFNSLLPGM